MTIPEALQIAMQHHQARRLAEAEGLCRQILAAQPKHADALHLLGVIAHQAGRHDLAVTWIRQSILSNPNNPLAHYNLGEACRASGRLDDAIAAYRCTVELKPDYAQAHNNLGAALAERGRFDEAIEALRRALGLNPDCVEAHNNLGNLLRERGRLDEALAAFRRAIEVKPHIPEIHNNLGNALRERGLLDEAICACRRALELKPDYPQGRNNLGNALGDQGRFDEAITEYRRALELKPDYAEACNNLGVALAEQWKSDEAVGAYRHALELKPAYLEACVNLGGALRDLGNSDGAIAAYRRALQLKPDSPEALNNLGNALKDQGELDEAIAAYRRALEIKPDYVGAHSNLVHTLHYHPSQDEGTISEEHRRWNRQFSDPLKQFIQPHANDRSLKRRRRIGYVSPDFRDHAVGRFVLPLFERHDRERFEILCYSGVARPDRITERLRGLADVWRETIGVSDARLAEIIREDGVDILLDLTMHTAGNRLPVFARQPAPVQVSWLGYPGGTGLDRIGYRLTDAHMDPPGEKPAWSAEEPVRLPDCWCCYQPMGECPEINALPALSAEGVTFGSLNNFAKINEGALAIWAQVLEGVKGSRLLMLCPEGSVRERVLGFFGARGIAAERVELAGKLPYWDYLRLYQRIDLGLDPFPYNGMTTTCDALWMGVPVLTLPGAMPISRAGLSLLSSVGLGEMAASSEEDYVRIAVELAGNLPRLADLRATLRPRMLASPLMDAPRFARNVEAEYRKMWQAWCKGQSPVPA